MNLDSLTTYKGKYNIAKDISLYGAYPILEGYKDYLAYGYHLDWQDAIGFNRFSLDVSYTTDERLAKEERLHLKGSYNFKAWNFHGAYNYSDFYDLFGPTKVSRKGYSYGIGYKNLLLYDKPREIELSCKIDAYGDLEILPDYQNISAGYDEMYSASVGLDYNFIERSLGAVDGEKGYALSAIAATSLVNEELYPNVILEADLGIPLPVHHSSIWLRNSVGTNTSKKENSFANFYFGGFGNNWIDKAEVKRFREYYSFPGFEINEIGGKDFARSLLELNLPPLRFREVGGTAFYARWLRPTIFTSILSTNVTEEDRGIFYNAGIQCDIRFITLSLLKTTFSFGFAAAWDKDLNRSEELMVSLKLF